MSDNKDVDENGSAVSGETRREITSAQKFGIAGLILVVFLSFIWIGQLSKTAKEERQPEMQVTTGNPLTPPPPQPPAVVTVAGMPMPQPSSPAPFLFGAQKKPEESPAESAIFAFSGGGVGAAAAEATRASAIAPVTPFGEAGPGGVRTPSGGPPGPLEARLKPTLLTGSRARLLPHPDMLVTQGTIIPCILQTAINTQLAGYVKCVLPNDVRSTTGNVKLLDRGTTVVGEIQGGLVRGQSRVFVLWDRAETPDHAVIDISSPGTDELGRSGVPGTVNNHWWERFGSAILLSVVQGGLQAGTALAANSGSNGGGGTYFNSFQQNGTNISDTALQASINIPPTLEKNQGGTVAIFVAKDLDFSDVYDLRVTGDRYAQ